MDGIEVFPLFSGSKGNCTLVRLKDTAILIDAGCGKKKTQKKLEAHGISLSDVAAIIITHCHMDHTRYLKDIANASECAIYCQKSVADVVAEMLDFDFSRIVAFDGKFFVGNLTITPFSLPHDSLCTGYRISSEVGDFTYMTDLGRVEEEILPVIEGSEKILIEANHDEEMLENGRYPYILKKRIASDFGHLSNESCAGICEKLYKSGTKEFILGHLSEENNCPELAYNAVDALLRLHGNDYKLFVATRNGLDDIV